MTKDEAREILTKEHFCLIHLERMSVRKPFPEQNVTAGVSYYCEKCRSEESAQRGKEIHEALLTMRNENVQ